MMNRVKALEAENVALKARVAELLEANNRKLEEAREARRQLREARAALLIVAKGLEQ